MIIAIVSSAGGLQPVEEFRDAATPADAVAAFCAEYTPPRDPADYLGEPTGWAAGATQLGRSWAWDSAALDLVEVGYTSDLVGQLETRRDERLADVVRAEYPAASGLLFSCSVAAQDSWSKLATLDVDDPGQVADLIASNLSLRVSEAQEILEIEDPLGRLRKVDTLLRRELDVTTVQAEIQSQAQDEKHIE